MLSFCCYVNHEFYDTIDSVKMQVQISGNFSAVPIDYFAVSQQHSKSIHLRRVPVAYSIYTTGRGVKFQKVSQICQANNSFFIDIAHKIFCIMYLCYVNYVLENS